MGTGHGTADQDLAMEQWYSGDVEMGCNNNPMTLRPLMRCRSLRRREEGNNQLDMLELRYNETIDQMMLRVNLPLATPSRASHPEYYTRNATDGLLWATRCGNIKEIMDTRSALENKIGVINARIMIQRAGPLTPIQLIHRAFCAVATTVGGHMEALQALLQYPSHMRTAGTPDHLMVTAAMVLVNTGDFSLLRAPPGSVLSKLCTTIANSLKATCDPRMLERSGTPDEKHAHLKVDVTAVPRPANHETDVALWTGTRRRIDQIKDVGRFMKRMAQTKRETLFAPAAQVRQVPRVAHTNGLLRGGVPESSIW